MRVPLPGVGESLPTSRGKDFLLKGGESTLAISKQRKDDLVAFYTERLKYSQAMIVTEYSGLNMKQMDDLRSKVREAGGEFHIVKNTLGQVAFESAGLPQPDKLFVGSTAIAFAFQDAPAMAKIIMDYERTSDFVKVKGGYLGKNLMNAGDVKSLAELPPLPVMRAQLLGVLSAPAGKLVRTLAEPARQVAAILKAYAEKDASQDAAPAAA
jgi:large subunit ribosomal protein L10